MSRKKKKETIQWVTVYLTGNEDFREEVREVLDKSELKFMPGFVETQPKGVTHDLYWIDSRTELRQLKEAIGGKLIWKYRLRFYCKLEDFLSASTPRADTGFSDRERTMISEMNRIEKGFPSSSEAA